MHCTPITEAKVGLYWCFPLTSEGDDGIMEPVPQAMVLCEVRGKLSGDKKLQRCNGIIGRAPRALERTEYGCMNPPATLEVTQKTDVQDFGFDASWLGKIHWNPPR